MGNGATAVVSPSVADWLRFVLPWVLIALGAVIAWRRRNRLAIAGVITAALALAAGFLTAMQAPVLPGTRLVFVYNVRFLWPIAMFFWFAVVFVTWQLIGPSRPVVRKVAVGVEAACIVVLAGVFLTHASAPRDDPGMALTRDLNHALAAHVHGPGPYVIRSQGGSGFSIVSTSTAVASGISVGLERRGVSTYTFPDVQASEATWGHRIYKGQPVKGTIWIVSGDSPAPTPTAQAIATANATTARERAEEQSLSEELNAAFGRTGVQPSDKGDRLLGGRRE